MIQDFVKSHWYANMYEQFVTETSDVECLLRLLGPTPKNVLEVCCGSGRVLVPIAMAGHHATGFDLDAEMLAYLPAKVNRVKQHTPHIDIHWSEKDLFQGDWGGPYDAIILAGNIMLNIITEGDYDAAQRRMLALASQHVQPQGHLILHFDCFAQPEEVFNSQRERLIFEGTDDRGVYGRYLICSGRYDPQTQMARGSNRTELTLPDGSKRVCYGSFAKHIPTLAQVHDWLQENDCVVVEEYGDDYGNPIGVKTHKAIIMAKKR